MLLIIFINGMATTQCYTYLHTRSPHYALPFYVSWLDSEITDLAGKLRFNGQSDYVYNIGFIQDIPSWGVAFGATHRKQGAAYDRVIGEEIRTTYGADLEIFVEKRIGGNFTIRAVGSNLLNGAKRVTFNKFDNLDRKSTRQNYSQSCASRMPT